LQFFAKKLSCTVNKNIAQSIDRIVLQQKNFISFDNILKKKKKQNFSTKFGNFAFFSKNISCTAYLISPSPSHLTTTYTNLISFVQSTEILKNKEKAKIYLHFALFLKNCVFLEIENESFSLSLFRYLFRPTVIYIWSSKRVMNS